MKHFHIALLVVCALPINDITANDIEEIVVKSSFIDQTLNEIENPLHVLDGEAVSGGSTSSLGESLDGLLGVLSTDYGSAVGQPVIRGMSGNRVKVLNNGRIVRDVSGLGADHINDVDLNDIQQIEVARGPSSLLFSNGSIGGIINIVDNTIAREDVEASRLVLGLETQSVNDGDAHEFSYQNNIAGLNLSLAYKDSQFGDYEIPDGAIHHDDEGHHDEDEEDHDEGEHEDELSFLPNTDFGSTSTRVGLSKTGDWGYFGLSAQNVESLYGIPFHREGHADHDEEENDGERIFSTTESNVINLEGSYKFNNSWLSKVDYFFRDSDYSLIEQHAEEQHEEQGHEEEGHEEEDHEEEEHAEHHAEGPTLFKNDAVEYGAIFDLTNGAFSQKVVLNFVDEDVSITGHEAFMNPTNNKESSLGYYFSSEIDLFHLDFGIRHDRIARNGSISHDEHDEGEEAHDGADDHHDEHEQEVEMFNRDINNTSFALTLSREINEYLDVNLGLTRFQRAPSAVELFINGPHLASGRFEVGNTGLKSETSNNIDLTFNYQNDGLFAVVTLFKNDVDNYIYLQDESDADHVGEDHDDHEGLVLANYLQQDARLRGYEFEIGQVLELANASITLSFGRDDVSGEFSDGSNIARMVPARNIYRFAYAGKDLDMELQLKDVEGQGDVADGEEVTDGYNMLNLLVKKSFNFNGSDSLSVSLFANNLLNEVARNHSSFVKDEVPLPGRNLGVKFRVKF